MNWTINPSEFGKQTVHEVTTLSKSIAFDVWNGVTQMSPVDTGRFRASWNISLGAIDFTVKGEGPHASPLPPSAPSQPFPTYYISNALPYADKLENGHSGQSPQGMVQVTVPRVVAKYS